MPQASVHTPTVLLIGASRGLGHAMAAEFLKNGWHVVGTVRAGGGRTLLHDLADAHPDRVDIEMLDITRPEQIRSLHERLSGRMFDILFVNAGTTNPDPTQTIGEVSTEDFVNLMITNALSPMRVVGFPTSTCPSVFTITILDSNWKTSLIFSRFIRTTKTQLFSRKTIEFDFVLHIFKNRQPFGLSNLLSLLL